MVLTQTERGRRINYKKYKDSIKVDYKKKVAEANRIKKDLKKISQTFPKGERAQIYRYLQLRNSSKIAFPKWTSYMLNYPQWLQQLHQPHNLALPMRTKIQHIIRKTKAKVKGIYGTKKFFGYENKAEKAAMAKDNKKMKQWSGGRFLYQGAFPISASAQTTQDTAYRYRCYARWSDDVGRDQFIPLINNLIQDVNFRHGGIKRNEMIRMVWEYFEDPLHPDETKYASTNEYVGSYNDLIPKVIKITNNNGDIYEGIFSTVIEVEFWFGTVPNLVGQGAAKSYAVAKKTWFEVSDKCEYNCQYYAFYRAITGNWWSSSKELKKQAIALKSNINPNIKTIGNADTLKLLCDYKQADCDVFNNIYMKKHEIKSDKKIDAKRVRKKKEKPVELRIANGHWSVLFRYKDLKPHEDTPMGVKRSLPQPSIVANDEEEEEEIDKEESVMLEAKPHLFFKTLIDTKIGTYDLETTKDKNGKCIVYKAAIAIPTAPITSTDDAVSDAALQANHRVIMWTLDGGGAAGGTTDRKGDSIFCDNPVKEMINEMLKYNGYTFYAHAGGKFDVNFIINQSLLLEDIIIKKNNVELNGRWLGITLQATNKNIIRLRDSWCMLPKKLDDCTQKFNVIHKKLTGSVDHDDIKLTNYMIYNEIVDKYLFHDVMGLLEVLFKFRNVVWDITLKPIKIFEFEMKTNGKGKMVKTKKLDDDGEPICTIHNCGINVTQCFTLASLAKKGFFRKFYNKYKYPIYNLSKELDIYLRDSYAGGRVECHQMYEIVGKIYYYDFTSLYPAMMVKDLPYGKPEKFDDPNQIKKLFNRDSFFGFIKCQVRQLDDTRGEGCKTPLHPPLHGIKLNIKNEIVRSVPGGHGPLGGKLTFPQLDNWTTMTLFTEEIKLGKSSGQYEYKFIDGIRFLKGPIMKEYVEELYSLKLKAQKEGNEVLRQTAKTWVNSAYGFWGLKCYDREGVKIEEEGSTTWQTKMTKNKLISVGKTGRYHISRFIEDVDIKEVNVAIASAITSYARCRLWDLTTDIINKGSSIYYMDTDSIMTSHCLEDDVELQKKYQWDGTGEELGSLKNEAKKNKYFTKLYIGGKKLYALTTRDNKLQKSCKGFSFIEEDDKLYMKVNGEKKELTYDHFKNQQIEGRQFTMGCGRNRFISEDDSFNTYFVSFTKTIKSKYTSGTIMDDGRVLPIII